MERIFTKEKKIKSLLSKHQFFDSLIQKSKKNISIDDLEINDLKSSFTVSNTHHHQVNAITANTVPIATSKYSSQLCTSKIKAIQSKKSAPIGATLPNMYQIVMCLFTSLFIHQSSQMCAILQGFLF